MATDATTASLTHFEERVAIIFAICESGGGQSGVVTDAAIFLLTVLLQPLLECFIDVARVPDHVALCGAVLRTEVWGGFGEKGVTRRASVSTRSRNPTDPRAGVGEQRVE